MTLSILWHGSSPALELGIPLPLDLDIAMGGPTFKGHSVAEQFVACDKMLLLLIHIWFNSQKGAKKSSSLGNHRRVLVTEETLWNMLPYGIKEF